ncbi:MAG TPA: acyloxyacyl hydrolase [Verrucomicrobiae bacterium]|nr:acyloxyacyl hydrolase [Verrucomicrobiae bacterium]
MRKQLCLLTMFISLGWETSRGGSLSLTAIENQDPPPAGSELNLRASPQPEPIWKNGIGEGFIKGTRELDLSVVGAFGITSLGIGSNNHNLIMAAVHYGWMFDDVWAENCWFRGNWEALVEGFGGAQYHPRTKYVAGITTIIRYNFATGTRWIPFISAGVGPSVTDIGSPDLSTTFEFNLQAGVGLHYFLRDNAAITAEARYLHFSNAGLGQPNEGVNTISYLVGFSWFF